MKENKGESVIKQNFNPSKLQGREERLLLRSLKSLPDPIWEYEEAHEGVRTARAAQLKQALPFAPAGWYLVIEDSGDSDGYEVLAYSPNLMGLKEAAEFEKPIETWDSQDTLTDNTDEFFANAKTMKENKGESTMKENKKSLPASLKEGLVGMIKEELTAYFESCGAGKLKQERGSIIEEEGDLDGKTDMTGKRCSKCGKGKYKETHYTDDMYHVLHCTKCGKEVERWQGGDEVDEAQSGSTQKREKVIEYLKKAMREAMGDPDEYYALESALKFALKNDSVEEIIEYLKKAMRGSMGDTDEYYALESVLKFALKNDSIDEAQSGSTQKRAPDAYWLKDTTGDSRKKNSKVPDYAKKYHHAKPGTRKDTKQRINKRERQASKKETSGE